jgi:guanylate kinase
MPKADPGPLLVVITGPSGVGKDTVLSRLKALRRPYHFAVTATTRRPRPAEIDGIDYYFLSDEQFDEMLANEEFLENAVVYDQRKGVPKPPIREALAAAKDVLMRTDIQGARYIKSLCPAAVTIFLLPPSKEEMEWRLRSRGTDTVKQMKLRLRTARDEIAVADEFDHTVVNDDLHACADEIERILAAERSRKGREPVRL